MRCILFPLVYAYMRDCNVYCGIVSCNSRHESRRVMCSNRLRRVLPTVNQRVTEYAKVKAWQHTASAPITTLVEATTNSYHTYATHATTVSSQKNKRTTLSQRSPPCARSILIMASIHLVNIHLDYIPHSILSLRTLPFNAPKKNLKRIFRKLPLDNFLQSAFRTIPKPNQKSLAESQKRGKWQRHLIHGTKQGMSFIQHPWNVNIIRV